MIFQVHLAIPTTIAFGLHTVRQEILATKKIANFGVPEGDLFDMSLIGVSGTPVDCKKTPKIRFFFGRQGFLVLLYVQKYNTHKTVWGHILHKNYP